MADSKIQTQLPPGDSQAGATLWAADPVSAETTRDWLVEQGFLTQEAAASALAEYREHDSKVSFSSYLLEKGLIKVDQLPEPTSDKAAPVEIAPGAHVSGCTIEKLLGQGGMGTVYLAQPDDGGERVVVKFLLRQHVRNKVWRARFLREALVLKKVKHENVVRVDSVEVQGDSPHIVMEFVGGKDLEETLRAEGRLEPREAARIARDIARGLAAAHAQGVIHRDVKPGNVRLTPAGEVKILDFGLARGVESDDGVSLAGQILGTPYYMAPEQWGDHWVDERADVFSLGATLYHLVTGEVPFKGRRPVSICRKTLAGEFTRPRALRPEISEDLELVILRCMAVDRRIRFADAQSCADALERVLEGRQVEVPCLAEIASGRRHPLLPGWTFLIGRDEDCAICLDDLSVSRNHARVRHGRAGYRLTDVGSSYGTWVNGMKVQDVQLKNGDVLRLGRVELEFRDGGVAATPPLPEATPAQLAVHTLPEPFMRALIHTKDRRSVIALLERIPPQTVAAKVASARTALRALFDGETAETVGSRLEQRLEKRRGDAIDRLFAITFENLRDDYEGWLSWWSEARAHFPAQLGPQRLRPRMRLRVVSGEDEDLAFELTERMICTIGRSSDCDIHLTNQSSSRHHATVLRLHQRLMLRDEGSRFGTRVNGQRVSTAFLSSGDRVTLGLVDLLFEAEDLVANPPQTADGMHLIDPSLFETLCDLRHPSVACALLRFIAFEAQLSWVERQAAKLFDDARRAQTCAEVVRAAYAERAAQARLLLKEGLVPGLPPAPSPTAEWFGQAYEVAKSTLAPQLLPVGWFQPTA